MPSLGHRQAEIGAAVVPNPYFAASHAVDLGNPIHIGVRVNVRESAVASLEASGHIEPHQVAAAAQFRRHFEAMVRLRSASLRERVDGGFSGETFTDRQLAAGQELRKARALLGRRGYVLIVRVCGEGRHLSEICATHRRNWLRPRRTCYGLCWMISPGCGG